MSNRNDGTAARAATNAGSIDALDLTVEQADLARALRLVDRAVPARGVPPAAGHVLLDATPGRLTLTATDLALGLMTAVAAEVARPGRVMLPAGLLGDYAAHLPAGPVCLTGEPDRGRVRVRGGRASADFAALAATDFPALPTPDLVPLDTLLRLPLGGLRNETLHARLDGGHFAAAAEFADWAWGLTGTAFLDFDDTIEIVDAHWTRAIVDDLAAQWCQADAILRRIDDLAAWLEADPPAHFAELLDAALREVAGEADDAAGGTGESPRDEAVPPEPAAWGNDDDRTRADGGDDDHDPTDPEDGGGVGERPVPARRAA